MCLQFNMIPTAQTAKADITVYKAFKKTVLLSRYFMWSPFRGKLYFKYRKLKYIYLTIVYERHWGRTFNIYEGYYSFGSLDELKEYFRENADDMIIKECTIQQGTEYFQSDSQIASSMLVVNWNKTIKL